MECIREVSDGTELFVTVQPKSSQNRIEGIFQGSLKVRISNPPAEGQANKACLKLLSKELGIPKSHMVISTGGKSRRKTIKISHHPVDEIRRKLSLLL